MKRFRDIIQDIKAPSTSDLWINNGELKYYTSNGWKVIAGNGSSDVYVLPGNLQTTEGWSTTDVESIVGNWDEFTRAVSDNKRIIASIYTGNTTAYTAKVMYNSENYYTVIIEGSQTRHEYSFMLDIIRLTSSRIVLYRDNIIDSLTSASKSDALSAKQGKILNDKIIGLEGKSNVAVLTPTGTKLMELVSSSPNVTQEQLVEAGFTPEICRRLNAGEVIYMSGECASFSNEALYPIQGITLNSSPDLVPPYLCYCYYSGYKGEGTASSGCFITIKENSPGKYLVDYIEV
jgi:hypothetical protein